MNVGPFDLDVDARVDEKVCLEFYGKVVLRYKNEMVNLVDQLL